MSARGYLFEGSLYMARIVGGVEQPLQGPFEGSQFAIQPNVERKEMVSRGRGTFGQVVESVNVPQAADFSVTLNEGTAETLALGLMGTVSALTQAAGNLTDEPVAVGAVRDVWLPLSKANFTGLVTVENAAGTVTYVEGTDYEVNRPQGWLKIKSGGAIAANSTVNVTAAYGAINGSKILGGAAADLRVKFVLDGRNLADGADCTVRVWEAIIAASDAVDFLSGEFVGVPLSGRMKTPAGKTAPFEVDLRNV